MPGSAGIVGIPHVLWEGRDNESTCTGHDADVDGGLYAGQ
jgi:hypothetical protein